ncbi:ferric reductase [Nocardioides sp. CGMCC 1.13656]|uniref:ferric reductase n=1 Tax=Nocardioides TaxID=1839 RepID=UPI0015ECC5CA|nr:MULTISPECIES: ferric reductase [unclassified Nocardioides]MBA2956147.1 ferric reductase [Nocardioides sp. CGMCC 1.13656]
MTLWFVARAAGFMAMLGATVAICLGATASGSTDATRRLLTQLAHRSAAVVTLSLLALHAALLVVDSHVAISVPGALVPFTAGYRAVAVGLGTLGMYCLVVVAITGALRGRLAGSARAARWWRPVHAIAYAVWPLAILHGIFAGTDTGTWWAWSLYGGSAGAVVLAVWWRLVAEERHLAGQVAVRRQQHRALDSAGRRS